MYVIPIQSPSHIDDRLVIILNDDNLARMAAHDPVTIDETVRAHATLVNPRLMICHENDHPELLRLFNAKPKNLKAVVEYLMRGYKFDPATGDGHPAYSFLDGDWR
jgi:hypothetical protein